jgi:DNA-binding CsgD family transcriptional regulator
METRSIQDQLTTALLGQSFSSSSQDTVLLDEYKRLVEGYVDIDHSIAVLSDFQANRSYIYVGSFGQHFGLSYGHIVIESAFEECIFDKVHPDDLTERHILELSYFEHQKSLLPSERKKYSTISRIRASNAEGEYSYINHRTIYLKSQPNDSVWLALCIYAPSIDLLPRPGIDGKIVNRETGESISFEQYRNYGQQLLSRREIEVLNLIAKGMGSKEIAVQLHIAVYTVRRHRQNIIRKMQVSNTAEAVKTGLAIGIIKV